LIVERDADILVHASDLPALCDHLIANDYVSVVDPASDRAWGALTKASLAPITPRESGEFYIDLHRLAIDYPACRSVPTAELFASSRQVETENRTLTVPGVEHSFLILALHAFRDFYEPRGVKALFDAAFQLSKQQPYWPSVEAMARRGRSVGRTIFTVTCWPRSASPAPKGCSPGAASAPQASAWCKRSPPTCARWRCRACLTALN